MTSPHYIIIVNKKSIRVYSQKEFEKILINIDGSDVPYYVKCYFDLNTLERTIVFYNFYDDEIGYIWWLYNQNHLRLDRMFYDFIVAGNYYQEIGEVSNT